MTRQERERMATLEDLLESAYAVAAAPEAVTGSAEHEHLAQVRAMLTARIPPLLGWPDAVATRTD